MRLLVLAVGRSRDAACDVLIDDYAGRLPWPFELVEVVPRRGQGDTEALLAAAPAGAALVALDERGRDLTSRDFADRLAAWRDAARPAVACLIGGPDGHDDQLRSRADLVLAFGRMTWPHRLARVMLVEQLYRATSILAGHPYHRD